MNILNVILMTPNKAIKQKQDSGRQIRHLFWDNTSEAAEGRDKHWKIEVTNNNPRNDSVVERRQAHIDNSTHIRSDV